MESPTFLTGRSPTASDRYKAEDSPELDLRRSAGAAIRDFRWGARSAGLGDVPRPAVLPAAGKTAGLENHQPRATSFLARIWKRSAASSPVAPTKCFDAFAFLNGRPGLLAGLADRTRVAATALRRPSRKTATTAALSRPSGNVGHADAPPRPASLAAKPTATISGGRRECR